MVDCLGATGEHGRPHLLNLAVKVRASDLELRMAACYHPARPKVTLHEPEVPLENVTSLSRMNVESEAVSRRVASVYPATFVAKMGRSLGFSSF